MSINVTCSFPFLSLFLGSLVKSPVPIKPLSLLPLCSHTLDACWLVIVRTQRSRCASWPSSLRCCSTLSSSASSSSTWTAWWTTPWRCTKTGRWWTCGVSRKRRLSERSKQFPIRVILLFKCVRAAVWMWIPAVWFCLSAFILNHFRFIQHPKNFGLIASFLERKVFTLGAPPPILSSSLKHLVSNGISLLLQTVAECVLFYYLTKKNENYKNIVRRNYRRRGRSQVFLQLLNTSVNVAVYPASGKDAPMPAVCMLNTEKLETTEHFGREGVDIESTEVILVHPGLEVNYLRSLAKKNCLFAATKGYSPRVGSSCWLTVLPVK